MKTFCVSFSGSVDIDAKNTEEAAKIFFEISATSTPIAESDILENIHLDEVSEYESVG